MRLYAVADIHTKPDRIDRVRKGVADYAPDVLVTAGDTGNYINPGRVFGCLNELGIPVLSVRGNTDRLWHERVARRYSNIVSLHMKEYKIKGFPFAGISGTVPVPFRSRFSFFETDMLKKAAEIIGPETILVVHPPPYGTLDRVAGRLSAGSKGLKRLIAGCRPRMVLCGHIHEDTGMAVVGDTLVINCSIADSQYGAIVDLDDMDPGRAPVVRMA